MVTQQQRQGPSAFHSLPLLSDRGQECPTDLRSRSGPEGGERQQVPPAVLLEGAGFPLRARWPEHCIKCPFLKHTGREGQHHPDWSRQISWVEGS